MASKWIVRSLGAISCVTMLAGAACYLTYTQLGYQTTRLDLLNPKSNYHRLWIEYIKEFGDEDDAVSVHASVDFKFVRAKFHPRDFTSGAHVSRRSRPDISSGFESPSRPSIVGATSSSAPLPRSFTPSESSSIK